MRRAAKRDRNHAEIVQALRAVGCSVLDLAAVGEGCPDLLVATPRCGNVLIEIKDGDLPPSARALRPNQVEWHRQWRGPVVTVLDVAEALAAVGIRPPLPRVVIVPGHIDERQEDAFRAITEASLAGRRSRPIRVPGTK